MARPPCERRASTRRNPPAGIGHQRAPRAFSRGARSSTLQLPRALRSAPASDGPRAAGWGPERGPPVALPVTAFATTSCSFHVRRRAAIISNGAGFLRTRTPMDICSRPPGGQPTYFVRRRDRRASLSGRRCRRNSDPLRGGPGWAVRPVARGAQHIAGSSAATRCRQPTWCMRRICGSCGEMAQDARGVSDRGGGACGQCCWITRQAARSRRRAASRAIDDVLATCGRGTTADLLTLDGRRGWRRRGSGTGNGAAVPPASAAGYGRGLKVSTDRCRAWHRAHGCTRT